MFLYVYEKENSNFSKFDENFRATVKTLEQNDVNQNDELLKSIKLVLNYPVRTLNENPNELIYSYVNLPLDYRHGSNLIPLTMAALIVTGDMLELGMGLFSTPVLHKIAVDFKRQLVSVDTDQKWLHKFILYNQTSAFHRINLLSDKEELTKIGLDKKWGVVLVDHIFADLRPINVIKFSNLSKVVIAHDTEKTNEQFYRYEQAKIRDHYKYVCKFSLFEDLKRQSYISTTIMSNFIDLPSVLKPMLDKVKTEFGHESCNLDF